MPTATRTIRKTTDRRTAARNGRIVGFGHTLDQWLARVEERLAGVAATHRGTAAALRRRLDVIADEVGPDGSAILEKFLTSMWRWSWDTATLDFVSAYPLKFWVARNIPIERMATEAEFGPEITSELDDIINGKVSDERAREIVREIEFPPPTEAEVTTILTDTTAPDGMSAMQRIKTVEAGDKSDLLRTVTNLYSEGAAQAKMTAAIQKYVGNVHYKAARIARTEGVRIAQAGLDKTWQEAGDLVAGIQWHSALTERTRESHAALHGKIYYRTSGGDFIAEDGEVLPPIPLAPNCLCWTTPVLQDYDTLIKDLPPVELGAPYRAGAARREREKAVNQST